jgi:hypothetical protein
MMGIRVDQHFRDVQPTAFGGAAPDWIVGYVFVGTDGKEYAGIYSAMNPNDKKTLSTAILLDKSRFIEVSRAQA